MQVKGLCDVAGNSERARRIVGQSRSRPPLAALRRGPQGRRPRRPPLAHRRYPGRSRRTGLVIRRGKASPCRQVARDGCARRSSKGIIIRHNWGRLYLNRHGWLATLALRPRCAVRQTDEARISRESGTALVAERLPAWGVFASAQLVTEQTANPACLQQGASNSTKYPFARAGVSISTEHDQADPIGVRIS